MLPILYTISILYMNDLIIEKDGVAVLQGKICPFRNPLVLPSPTIAGQLIIENIPCTSACPLFQFNKLPHQSMGKVTIHCGNKEIIYEVDVIKNSNLTL